jgi:hypothetical protein
MSRAVAASILVALAGCSPKAETPNEADISRPGNPFFGSWRTETAQVAPWWDGAGAAPQMNADFQNTTIVFAAGISSGPKLLACDAPVYAVSLVTPEGLFEGNLPNPAADAATLGFPETEIQSLNLSCSSGDKDVSLDFAMTKDDTILLGLDNMIYTLKRQPS